MLMYIVFSQNKICVNDVFLRFFRFAFLTTFLCLIFGISCRAVCSRCGGHEYNRKLLVRWLSLSSGLRSQQSLKALLVSASLISSLYFNKPTPNLERFSRRISVIY